jgi:hypothetical protein
MVRPAAMVFSEVFFMRLPQDLWSVEACGHCHTPLPSMICNRCQCRTYCVSRAHFPVLLVNPWLSVPHAEQRMPGG